jgi:hypothetical protein
MDHSRQPISRGLIEPIRPAVWLSIIAFAGLSCGGSVTPAGTHPENNGGYSATDQMACTLSPSNYDTSCSTESDCVGVAFGNFCASSTCACATMYISRNALAQYMADFSRTPTGMESAKAGPCYCPLLNAPCCQAGQCCSTHIGPSGPVDAAYVPPAGSTLCSTTLGPVDAAVADAGQIKTCLPSQTCTPFNGGWACCEPQNFAGTLCR